MTDKCHYYKIQEFEALFRLKYKEHYMILCQKVAFF